MLRCIKSYSSCKLTQRSLFNKYPKIFIQNNWHVTHTGTYWGLDIEKGWYHIIDDLCQKIQDNVDKREIEQINAVRIKEKFGGLRFYVNYHDDEIFKLIRQAEYKCTSTCKNCSGKGKARRDHYGHINILCHDCYMITKS